MPRGARTGRAPRMDAHPRPFVQVPTRCIGQQVQRVRPMVGRARRPVEWFDTQEPTGSGTGRHDARDGCKRRSPRPWCGLSPRVTCWPCSPSSPPRSSTTPPGRDSPPVGPGSGSVAMTLCAAMPGSDVTVDVLTAAGDTVLARAELTAVRLGATPGAAPDDDQPDRGAGAPLRRRPAHRDVDVLGPRARPGHRSGRARHGGGAAPRLTPGPRSTGRCRQPRAPRRPRRPAGDRAGRHGVLVVPHRCTPWMSRVDDVRNTSSASSSAVIGRSRSSAPVHSSTSARVTPARQPEHSGGVASSPSSTTKTLDPVPSQRRPAVFTSTASVRAARLGVGERDHVVGVRRRLQPGGRGALVAGPGHDDHLRRRRPGGHRGHRDDQGRAGVAAVGAERAGAAGQGDAQPQRLPVVLGVGGEHLVDGVAQQVEVGRVEPEAAGRARQPVEVPGQRERDSVDDLGRLEHPVADGEPVVEDRDQRRVGPSRTVPSTQTFIAPSSSSRRWAATSSSRRAFSSVSSHSPAASEPQVMPAPVPRCSRPSATRTSGCRRRGRPAAGRRRPSPPRRSRARAARARARAIAVSALDLGAPVTEPGGKVAAEQGRPAGVRTQPGRARSRRGARGRGAPRRRTARGTSTEPVTATAPRSLRTRSTIITFSARSLAVSPAAVARGALDRPGLDQVAVAPQEQLRRGGHDVDAGRRQPHDAGVRRRVARGEQRRPARPGRRRAAAARTAPGTG